MQSKIESNGVTNRHSLPSSCDIKNVSSEYDALHKLIADSSTIIIDASAVSKITTPAIQVLISLSKFCKENKIDLILEGTQAHFEAAFKDLGLASTSFFQINGSK